MTQTEKKRSIYPCRGIYCIRHHAAIGLIGDRSQPNPSPICWGPLWAQLLLIQGYHVTLSGGSGFKPSLQLQIGHQHLSHDLAGLKGGHSVRDTAGQRGISGRGGHGTIRDGDGGAFGSRSGRRAVAVSRYYYGTERRPRTPYKADPMRARHCAIQIVSEQGRKQSQTIPPPHPPRRDP
jgi:hypothetical protein